MSQNQLDSLITALESLNSKYQDAALRYESAKLAKAIAQAECWARGVEGKNAEERGARVTLETRDVAERVIASHSLVTSLEMAREIMKLRIAALTTLSQATFDLIHRNEDDPF